jgi:hypothetical protein
MDYLYSMPPLSTQAPRVPATALKKENDQIAATFGTRGSQPQRSGSGVPPLPQLPPPEHFPPALQALAEQQRLFMERKYQEQVWLAPVAVPRPPFQRKGMEKAWSALSAERGVHRAQAPGAGGDGSDL